MKRAVVRLTARLAQLEREHDEGYTTPLWGRAMRECPPTPLGGDDVDMLPTMRHFAKLVACDVLEVAAQLKRYFEESGQAEGMIGDGWKGLDDGLS